ncbi:MAG: stage V sporulation protein AC [Oscillospiraceae bacterium]|nr:stage V sporulation protein AC [Oscillospiraceae bacterium]
MGPVKTTKEQYAAMAKEASRSSPSWKNIPLAFLSGGLICMLGQGLLELYQYLGLNLDRASLLVSVSLVFLSVLLTGLGVYDRLAKHAGAGTLVPITGFANAVAAPALEFKSEGMIMGLGAKLFAIAGPVIVYGVAASWVYGIVLIFLGHGGMQ